MASRLATRKYICIYMVGKEPVSFFHREYTQITFDGTPVSSSETQGIGRVFAKAPAFIP